jgi:hypothetical protein
MSRFSTHFEAAIPQLRASILAAFRAHQTQAGYRSVWEHFEDVIDPVLIDFLTRPPLNIARNDIKIATSKSVYPSLKIKYEGKDYAIDVKSGEDNKNPWYDMGRLDTYEENHLDKYEAEYCVTVRWRNHDAPEVVNVYIEPAYCSVGYRDVYDGVLYRPYDGKLRPKPWSDFENGVTHWRNEAEFRRGLEAAKIHRRMYYIINWYIEMEASQRAEIKKAIDDVNKGKKPTI